MPKREKFKLFPKYSDSLIFIGALALAIYGSFMIISAEMGESTGDLQVISATSIKQFIYLVLGFIALIVFTKIRFIKLRMHYIWTGYFILLGLLFATRMFTPVGGAYGWIRIGPLSLQPSEFAKLYVIFLAARLFDKDNPKLNKKHFWKYALAVLGYFFVVLVVQNDFGSAFVIFAIAYVCVLIPPYRDIKHYQNRLILLLLLVIGVGIFLLSPIGTSILENLSGYQVKRFLASANPFAYQYDSGYHLIMSLVSFATGGLFGLGYSKSIHKFMNFPNPSTDFILPVIVEEMGIVFGLVPIIILFGLIVVPLMYHAIKCPYTRGKIVIIGSFMYFILHFVLNVGGVSGLIPLTGVPLLLVSSGGSSLMSCMATLGLAENEIIKYKKDKQIKENENNIR